MNAILSVSLSKVIIDRYEWFLMVDNVTGGKLGVIVSSVKTFRTQNEAIKDAVLWAARLNINLP